MINLALWASQRVHPPEAEGYLLRETESSLGRVTGQVTFALTLRGEAALPSLEGS